MRDELESIDGVGPATADAIIDVVEDTQGTDEWLERAYRALENGNEERALVYLKRSK